jgi:hypothetical protein
MVHVGGAMRGGGGIGREGGNVRTDFHLHFDTNSRLAMKEKGGVARSDINSH